MTAQIFHTMAEKEVTRSSVRVSGMEIVEIRAAIKYLYIKGLSGKDAYEDLVATLGEKAPSFTMVKKWFAEFKRGRTSTEDAERSGRPSDVSSPETIDRVLNIILTDRRVTIRHVSDVLNISYGSVQSIITERIGMHKVSARWVPRMLTQEMKQSRVTASQENLNQWQRNPEDFLNRVVTVDETWVHHFDPETKLQSKEWKRPSSPTPRKFRHNRSAGKVMLTVFWDAQGVIMTDYLEKGATINKEYYSEELKQLREELKRKRRGKLSKGVLLLQDNAPPHTAQLSVTTASQCGYELLPHPAYSPDLAPSDFYLFPLLKESLRGRKFEDNEDVIGAVESFLDEKDPDFFRQGFLELQQRWTKCIQKKGDYVEK